MRNIPVYNIYEVVIYIAVSRSIEMLDAGSLCPSPLSPLNGITAAAVFSPCLSGPPVFALQRLSYPPSAGSPGIGIQGFNRIAARPSLWGSAVLAACSLTAIPAATQASLLLFFFLFFFFILFILYSV